MTSYLRQYTRNWIGMSVGVPTILEIFDPKYYTDLEGGILEGLGRLFQGQVKLFVYPTRLRESDEITSGDRLQVKPELYHLYRFLVENGGIESIREFNPADLHITPAAVLASIQAGDPGWENLMPGQAAEVIKNKHLFNYRASQPGNTRSAV